jgi:hypothetical protein
LSGIDRVVQRRHLEQRQIRIDFLDVRTPYDVREREGITLRTRDDANRERL